MSKKKNQARNLIISFFIVLIMLSLAVGSIFFVNRQTALQEKIEYKDFKCDVVNDCINQFKNNGVSQGEIELIQQKGEIFLNNYCIIKEK